ncbi:MAG TPA: methionyl-tRNA formyltransferase [Steroidobacteraceae bacterium]
MAGTPEFALPALTALLAQHSVVGVLTQPDRPSGRGRKLAASPVKIAAQAHRLPLAQPQTLNNAAGRAALEAWGPQLLVVVAYGLILPREVLTLPPLGCVNRHASLRPRWRGAAPIQRAILAGDTETGVTLIQMDAGLDTGPMLLQRRLAISANHTGGSLHDELSTLGASALLEALDGLSAGTLRASAQPLEGVTYAAKIQKNEARIDWSRDALEIERQIRAFNPWPVAETQLAGEPLRILAAQAEVTSGRLPAASVENELEKGEKNDNLGSIISLHDDFMLVRCGRGYLRVTQVQRPGRRPVSVRDYSHSVALAGRKLG